MSDGADGFAVTPTGLTFNVKLVPTPWSKVLRPVDIEPRPRHDRAEGHATEVSTKLSGAPPGRQAGIVRAVIELHLSSRNVAAMPL
jgi:hypothetical protein